jgi:glycerol dehydrogenase-like iron-containing ADH family enzyme
LSTTAWCPDCGNARPLFNQCPYCGSLDSPDLGSDVIELNIKLGQPTVEEALENLTEQLRKCSELGIKAIVLIHGYGSSGEGGRIKWAIHDALENNRYADRVTDYFFGEKVAYGTDAYHALLKRRPSLRQYLKLFKEGNAGMTVLLLGTSHRNA